MTQTYALLRRVCVVKPDEEFALVHLRKVLVEHGCLCVSNVQVATRLGRETGDNLTLLCVGETEGEGRGSLV